MLQNILWLKFRPNFLGICFHNATSPLASSVPLWVYENNQWLNLDECTGPSSLITSGVMSFPSGHSCGAFAMVVYNFLLIRRVLPAFYCPLVLTVLLILKERNFRKFCCTLSIFSLISRELGAQINEQYSSFDRTRVLYNLIRVFHEKAQAH